MITIKKYANRRLYDTSTSAYITLEELAKRVREGEDVRVIDANSEEDLTQEILAQIILESRGAARLLPVPLLMRLVRMQEDHLAEFFGQFMSWSLEIYLRFKQGYESMAPYNPLSAFGLGENNPVARMFGQQNPWQGAPPWKDFDPAEPISEAPTPSPDEAPPEPGEQEDAEPATGDDVAQMREEIDELKDLVRKMAEKGGE